jgi:drug/metabolite transporter (DMT)-like permease
MRPAPSLDRPDTVKSPAKKLGERRLGGLSREHQGLLFGMLGVVMLSVTLPATRLAVADFDPLLVGMARTIVPAIPAAILLLVTRQARPTKKEVVSLLIASIGIVYGFPILMTVAMKTLPSAHGAVVTGIMPLATAAVGAVVSGDRPSWGFWLCGIAGSAAVVAYALIDGAGSLAWADLLLVLGILTAALGYAVGGQAAKRLGGWQTICWIMVLALPLSIALVPVIGPQLPSGEVSNDAWFGLLYVVFGSQFLSFFAWYRGLALGGVTRVSQLLLLQPCITLVFAAWLVGEKLGWIEIGFTALIVAIVAIGRRMPIRPGPID